MFGPDSVPVVGVMPGVTCERYLHPFPVYWGPQYVGPVVAYVFPIPHSPFSCKTYPVGHSLFTTVELVHVEQFDESLGTGKYPVILTLCEARVGNVGINYSPTDKIIIEPANGAEATPVFGSFGTLSEVKIISTGTGFTEKPKIYIESETGYNSEIIPILCVTRVGENEIKDPTYQDKIISVIDCVGKV